MILVNLTYSLGSCLHFLARILFNTMGNLKKKKKREGIYPRVTLDFFNLVGGPPKHFPLEVYPFGSLTCTLPYNINRRFPLLSFAAL